MPPDQIQIKWSTWSGRNYEDSFEALKQYDPIPSVKAAVNIKGTMPKDAIDRIMDIVNAFDADASVIMTATWGNNAAPNQLRLFGPNSSGNGRRRGRQRNQQPADPEPPEDAIDPPTPDEIAMENADAAISSGEIGDWEYPHADGNAAAEARVDDDSEPSPEEVAEANIAEAIH